jgi:hypothetical protein
MGNDRGTRLSTATWPASAPLTRRQLLARGGAAVAVAVAGAAVLPRRLDDPRAVVAEVPRRCVAFGPAGCIAPGCPQDLRANDNRALLAQSATRWVRLWADWPTLMPAPATFAQDRVAALDAQVAQARADGLHVILTLYRFPAWVNGVASAQLFAPPSDVSTSGPWGQFVAWVVGRYGPAVDVLELCNEPNLQWSDRRVAPETVAAMFDTAQRIAGELGSSVVLAGPGLSDVDGYDHFTDQLLSALQARRFVPGPRFAWTHHTYSDVAYGTSRLADVRRRLAGRWAGWPGADAGDPQLLVTESGITLRTIERRLGVADPDAQRLKQADLLRAAWDRLAEGDGVALFTQYLFYSDPSYDSGLCEPAEAGGARRPAFAAWAALPSIA